MIHSTVASRLDYCNSLLYGAKQYHIDRLQCCQNNEPGLYLNSLSLTIWAVLRELHWFPDEHRIRYKILLLTYKAPSGHVPQYLAALISKYVPPRPSVWRIISPQFTKMAAWNIWKTSFLQGSPGDLYPSTPQREACIDSFNARLKTYLFNNAFCICNSVTSPCWLQ